MMMMSWKLCRVMMIMIIKDDTANHSDHSEDPCH